MIEVACKFCGDTVQIPITKEECVEIMTREDKCIQDIVPNLAPGYREMFISGMCPKCWDNMFGLPEED